MRENLSVLIKPASSLCNLHCKYCFYRDIKENPNPVMDVATARQVVDKSLGSVPKTHISFAFQGGEPTICGAEFFKNFAEYVHARKSDAQTVSYSIQTNGTLIDEDFARIFKENSFLVGLSIDGPQKNHDALRPHAQNGASSHAQVMRALHFLKECAVDVNVLTVLTKPLAKTAKELFEFYVNESVDHAQIIPCLNDLKNQDGPWSLSPHEYASFLKEFFELWYAGVKIGAKLRVRVFDNILLMLNGFAPEQCGMGGTCHLTPIIESDGSVFPCDFYCADEFKLGNIKDCSLADIFGSSAARKFLSGREKRGICADCKAFGICGGNCKRYEHLFFAQPGYCPMRDFLYSAYPKLYDVAHNYTKISYPQK